LVVSGVLAFLGILARVLIRRTRLIIHRRVARAVGLGTILTTTGLVALQSLGLPAASVRAASSGPGPDRSLTPARLAADLVAGVRTIRVPPNLTPPLAVAGSSKPVIVDNGCSLQYVQARSKPCIYGDTRSRVSVVLFGDSHAATWFPALDLISKQQHWRLVDFTKASCTPAEVDIRFFGSNALYSACTAWRHTSKAQIAALHPALVILSWARVLEPEARPEPGVPTGYGSAWLNGLADTFHFLHRVARHVIFISDVPNLRYPAPSCVSTHMSSVPACTVTRTAGVPLPGVKQQELQLAGREQVSTIDPTSWFCDPTRCPVIVRNILLYRDNGHIIPAWSQFIAPVLAASILAVMNNQTAGRADR
jgi:SGNH domain (fused to AT3 domains)